MTETSVEDRLRSIRQRIEGACRKTGREAEEIVLVGASKRQSIEVMRRAYDAGLRIFGENRVQEAEAKRPELPVQAEWHLIGPLQSNKAKRAVQIFDVVHSVDRIKIARLLDREAAAAGRRLEAFLEVNLGGEETKHGFAPTGLVDRTAELFDLPALEIVGLMAIPPQSPSVEGARRWFRELRRLRDRMASAVPSFRGCLSMGMSGDFDVAVEEGATHVRIGTLLFGPRPAP